MREALKQAKLAKSINEVPVGAIIVKNSKIIGSGHNQNISSHSVSAHAEINAINEAGLFLKNYRLVECDMYVTVEPCHMCAKAIVDARIRNLYFACPQPKMGSVISVDNLSFKHSFIKSVFLDLISLNSGKYLPACLMNQIGGVA